MVARDFLGGEALQQWAARLGAGDGFVLSNVQLARLEEEIKVSGQEATTAKYLHDRERRRLESLGSRKRRLEWLGGRIAAKYAAGRFVGGLPGNGSWLDFVVSANGQGKPFLEAAQGRKDAFVPEISISHSGGQAMAMAAKMPCGIDLQQCTSTVLRVAGRFSAADERSLLANCPSLATQEEANRLTLLWSAKEAIRKMVAIQPLIGFMELELVNVTGPWEGQEGLLLDFTCARHKGLMGGPGHLKVMALLDEDFAVAVTINDLQR